MMSNVHDTLSWQAERFCTCMAKEPQSQAQGSQNRELIGGFDCNDVCFGKMQHLAFVPRFSTNGLQLACI
jgi:hypothetical protein